MGGIFSSEEVVENAEVDRELVIPTDPREIEENKRKQRVYKNRELSFSAWLLIVNPNLTPEYIGSSDEFRIAIQEWWNDILIRGRGDWIKENCLRLARGETENEEPEEPEYRTFDLSSIVYWKCSTGELEVGTMKGRLHSNTYIKLAYDKVPGFRADIDCEVIKESFAESFNQRPWVKAQFRNPSELITELYIRKATDEL